jgi:hypothetical protein
MLRASVLCAVFLAQPLAAADALIAHPGMKVALTEDEARDLLLGVRTTWQDGTHVVVVLVAGARQPALEHLTGRSAEQLMRVWKRLVFTGRSSMPLQCMDEAEVVAKVATIPGAIAIIDQVVAHAGVAVLFTREVP